MPVEFNSVDSVVLPQQAHLDHDKRSEHGLITEAFGIAVDSLQGKSTSIPQSETSKSQWGVAEVASGFVKAVPLFMGPGRGMVLSAALYGLDEVHSGDNRSTQLADFALGSAKGAASKMLMDKFGASEISLTGKGIAIGGGTSLIDSALTRTNWLDQKTGETNITGGLQKTALHAAFGSAVGMAAFPIGNALSSKLTPSVERLVGNRLDGNMVAAVTTGGAFGFTSGVVGESASQLYSGTFNPLAIAKRGLIEGLSTSAAGGVGHRFSAQYTLNHGEAEPNRIDTDSKVIDTNAKATDTNSRATDTNSKPIDTHAANLEATGSTGLSELSDAKVPRPVLKESFWSSEVKNFHANLLFKPAPAPPLSVLARQLGPATAGTYERFHLPKGAKFESESEFLSAIHITKEPAVIYKFGSTEIVVPAAYHEQLDQVRQLRLEAARTTKLLDRLDPADLGLRIDYSLSSKNIDKLEAYVAHDGGERTIGQRVKADAERPDSVKLESIWPGYNNEQQIARFADLSPKDLRDSIPILKANLKLEAHPMSDRTLPEDVLPMLMRLPDRSKIKRLELLDEENVYDIGTRKFDNWVIANYKDSWAPFRAAATAEQRTATVRFYKAEINTRIESTLKHEQVHLNHHPAYKYARQMDEALEASTYGYRNDHESEAELESKAFLSQIGTFMEAVRRAPTRMSLLASKLTHTIEEAAPENRSMDEQEILARARYIEKKILPAVLENVIAKVESEPTSRAVDLLAALSGNSDNPRMRDAFIKAATTHNGNFLSAIDGLKSMSTPTALSALRTMVEQTTKPDDAYKRQHFIGEMLQLSANKRGSQERTLVEWGQPNSSIRDAARDYLSKQDEYWFISNDGIMSRPVSDDYMMLPPDGQRATAVRARYTLDHGDDFQKRVAAIKLGMHGKDDDIPRLMQAATDPNIDAASSALRSALRLTTDNQQATMIDHLERFALSSSPLHPAARKMFDQMHGDDRIGSYRQVFGVINDPHYFMPEKAAQMLSRLPANAARTEWMHDILATIHRGASHHLDIAAENRQGFLEAVAKTIPDLREHALELLNRKVAA